MWENFEGDEIGHKLVHILKPGQTSVQQVYSTHHMLPSSGEDSSDLLLV